VLDAWSVVQLIVVAIDVVPLVVTAEMTGAAAVVIKVLFPEVAEALALSVEVTSKSYVVPGVSPVSKTEWEVVRPAVVPVEP
jgi:hypothetical protein